MSTVRCGGGHETGNSTTAADSTRAPSAPGGSPPTPKPATLTLFPTRPLRTCPSKTTMLPWQGQHRSRQARRVPGHPLRHPRTRQKLRTSQPQRENLLHDQRQRRPESRMVPLLRSRRSHHRRVGASHRSQPQRNHRDRKNPNRKTRPSGQAQEVTSRPAGTSSPTASPTGAARLGTQPAPGADSNPYCRL